MLFTKEIENTLHENVILKFKALYTLDILVYFLVIIPTHTHYDPSYLSITPDSQDKRWSHELRC